MVEIGKMNIRIPVKRMKCAKGSFRFKTLSVKKGIKGLLCCPARQFKHGRCADGMKLVTAIYSKAKWSPSKAKAHAKKRFKR